MKFVIPEVVTSQFHLREGDKVIDFGAGRGFFLQPLHAVVGETGAIYLCEIQKELVEFVSEKIRLAGFTHAKTAWCDLEEPNGIPVNDGAFDVGILVNTLFQLEDKTAAAAEMVRTLRPGGKLLVIDWTETVVGMGPAPDQLVLQADCAALFESHGCILEREFPAGEHHYGLAFRKI